MNRPSQRELFAQRPVRSDFARRRSGGGPGFNPKKLLLVVGLVALAVGGGFAYNLLGGGENKLEEIPTLQADMPIKERPEQPGGIDIPHQDVAVFEKLDKGGEGEKKADVEHLLPGPEEPNEPPAISEAVPAPAPEASPVAQAPVQEELPPAVTAAIPEPVSKAVEPTPAPAAEIKKPEPSKPEVKTAKVKAVTPPKEVKKTVETAPKTIAAVKEKATAVTDDQAKKAETAMARLPKELFTNDEYTPSSTITPASEPAPVSTTASKTETVTTSSSGKMASVQFASVQDQAQAEKSLGKFQSKYAGLLGGVSLRVVRADLGVKGIYYRVMTAPVSEDKAKAICADVMKQKGSCIVVK
jgi:hypothetical protein